jgi:hypothetical protein
MTGQRSGKRQQRSWQQVRPACLLVRVADPYSFYTDPNPGVSMTKIKKVYSWKKLKFFIILHFTYP